MPGKRRSVCCSRRFSGLAPFYVGGSHLRLRTRVKLCQQLDAVARLQQEKDNKAAEAQKIRQEVTKELNHGGWRLAPIAKRLQGVLERPEEQRTIFDPGFAQPVPNEQASVSFIFRCLQGLEAASCLIASMIASDIAIS